MWPRPATARATGRDGGRTARQPPGPIDAAADPGHHHPAAGAYCQRRLLGWTGRGGGHKAERGKRRGIERGRTRGTNAAEPPASAQCVFPSAFRCLPPQFRHTPAYLAAAVGLEWVSVAVAEPGGSPDARARSRGVHRAGLLLPRLPRAGPRRHAGPGGLGPGRRGDPLHDQAPAGHLVPRQRHQGPRPDGPRHGAAGALLHAVPDPRHRPRPRGTRAGSRWTRPCSCSSARRSSRPTGRPGPACSSTSSRPSRGTGSATRTGLRAMADDPFFDEDWRDYILALGARLGDVDFADLIYVRSAYFVAERRRKAPEFVPKYPHPLRREGGEDRPRQPRPRPALPLLGPAAPARLPRGPPPQAARRGRGADRPARTAGRAAREPPQGRRGRHPQRLRPLPVPGRSPRTPPARPAAGASAIPSSTDHPRDPSMLRHAPLPSCSPPPLRSRPNR